MPDDSKQFAVVIPAYQPGPALPELVHQLSSADVAAIVIVDDGSGPACAPVLDQLQQAPRATVLRHAINLGKGAALRTGINHVLCEFPHLSGLVTADADGQHAVDDILRVGRELSAHPDSVILGTREFGRDVPLRSRIGNYATSVLVRFLVGRRLDDTQTGLRGLPIAFLPNLLKIGAPGYEFELEMLIAIKHMAYPVRQVRIRTIYSDGNKSSHFNPILDSARIYFVLLRFSALALLTAGVDNLVFWSAFSISSSLGESQIAARLVAVMFNYTFARRAVFLSRQDHREVLPKYLMLVVCSGTLSYFLIRLLTSLAIGVMPAKLLAEGLIFIANFTVLRDFVFTKREPAGAATDWDAYYSSVPFTAKLTRKYTSSVLVGLLQELAAEQPGRAMVVEIGGANSCFYEHIHRSIQPREYLVIDNNEYGLKLLRDRTAEQPVRLLQESVLDVRTKVQADVVFSVGLIEHFNPSDTREAVRAHFELLRPGGYAILSFPTPTLLYRTARRLCEIAGLWKFPDERPLQRDEVRAAAREQGQIVYEKMLWPLVLTQALLVVRKEPATH